MSWRKPLIRPVARYRETGQTAIGKRDRQPTGSGTGGYRESGQLWPAKPAKQKAVAETNYLLITKYQPKTTRWRLLKRKELKSPGGETRADTIPWEGRDELNLAEFPIAILASRPDKTLKTVQFEDRVWDKGSQVYVPRRLTISASDRYGLPTALDDELVLGLIQLTREDEFQSRKVFFSRYHLLKILGWRTEGKNYARLETSLKRWLGVTFYYQNAWWDKSARAWVDENFHLLEQVSLYGRNRRTAGCDGKELALSMFVWNEVVFRSFQAGYLKQIDLALFRRLKSPVAKRLYRLLDKRFYHRVVWHFDLRELACEHVGLSRGYDIGQLKRKLRPAIGELVEVGYLEPMADQNRFARRGDGQWQVVLARGKMRPMVAAAADFDVEGKSLLVDHGVRPATAEKLACQFPADEIRRRIAILDWLQTSPGNHPPRNPAGYLVQSLRDGYDPPQGFLPASSPGGSIGGSAGKEKQASSRLDRFLRTLAPTVRERLETAALKEADPTLSTAYQKAVDQSSPLLAQVYRKLIVERYVDGRLAKNKQRKRGKPHLSLRPSR